MEIEIIENGNSILTMDYCHKVAMEYIKIL